MAWRGAEQRATDVAEIRADPDEPLELADLKEWKAEP